MSAPDEPADEITAILGEVNKVESVISTARRLLADGKMVDLTALEGKVRTLCNRIADADLDHQAADVGESLKSVLDKLQQLGDELTAQHGSVGGETSGASIKSAIDAYKKDA